jgi:hypothetical protein
MLSAMSSDQGRRRRARPNSTYLVAVLVVVGIAFLGRAEVMNYLYITRFLWQFLTGLPLMSPITGAGGI